jgi:uncharacterized protein (DUF2252 family)
MMSSRKSLRPSDRASALKVRQTLKMARSAHAYVRGSTVQFYQWLEAQKRGTLPEGPPVWICGDCHAGNLGPVAGVDGRIAIQIRDLDQTVIGNPAHDIIRLALSLATASRGSDLPGVTTAHILEQVIEGYRAALRQDADTIEDAPGSVQQAMKQSIARSWKSLAEERLENRKPTIPLGEKFWVLSRSERDAVAELFATPMLHHLSTSLRSRDDEAPVEVLDAAYWMKGCSSLGLLRYAALIRVGSGKKSGYRLLDVKEAAAAVGPRAKKPSMPTNNAERVVAGANALSPYLGERMAAATIARKPVFVRELRPQDMKFELENLQKAEAIAIARLMAGVVGRAHGRQMDTADRRAWVSELRARHSKGLDAPRWLWSSVLDLAALHEAAYLEHCRQYALGKPA